MRLMKLHAFVVTLISAAAICQAGDRLVVQTVDTATARVQPQAIGFFRGESVEYVVTPKYGTNAITVSTNAQAFWTVCYATNINYGVLNLTGTVTTAGVSTFNAPVTNTLMPAGAYDSFVRIVDGETLVTASRSTLTVFKSPYAGTTSFPSLTFLEPLWLAASNSLLYTNSPVWLNVSTQSASAVTADLADHKTNATAHAALLAGYMPTGTVSASQDFSTNAAFISVSNTAAAAYPASNPSNLVTSANVTNDLNLAVSPSLTGTVAKAAGALQLADEGLQRVGDAGWGFVSIFPSNFYGDYTQPMLELDGIVGDPALQFKNSATGSTNIIGFLGMGTFPDGLYRWNPASGLDGSGLPLNPVRLWDAYNLTNASQVGAIPIGGTASNVTTAAIVAAGGRTNDPTLASLGGITNIPTGIIGAGGLTNIAVNGTTGTVSGGIASVTIAAGGGVSAPATWDIDLIWGDIAQATTNDSVGLVSGQLSGQSIYNTTQTVRYASFSTVLTNVTTATASAALTVPLGYGGTGAVIYVKQNQTNSQPLIFTLNNMGVNSVAVTATVTTVDTETAIPFSWPTWATNAGDVVGLQCKVSGASTNVNSVRYWGVNRKVRLQK